MVYSDPIDMVNDYLRQFGEDVGTSIDPLDAGGYTDIRHGSLIIGINALVEHGVLLLLVRMGRVPEVNKHRLYRKLLELNFLTTVECAFAIDDQRDTIYLRSMRLLAGLDYAELHDLLETIARVANKVRGLVPELDA